mmetsp:Transcript_75747/g.222094  ORF Transcript_75747/g.222094 Transcript_75747/m.222094 type:complete len:208 (+) Transcript_75747:1242-1865(+)
MRCEIDKDSPDILPALEADSIQEGILQRIRAILCPSITYVCHTTAVKPLQPVDTGGDRILVGNVVLQKTVLEVAPAHGVPLSALPGCILWPLVSMDITAALHLAHDRISILNSSCPELPIHRGHGVAVETVAARLFQQLCKCHPVRLALDARALVPRVVGPEHSHAAGLEGGGDVPQPLQSARQGAEVVELVPGVDADVGVGRPEED